MNKKLKKTIINSLFAVMLAVPMILSNPVQTNAAGGSAVWKGIKDFFTFDKVPADDPLGLSGKIIKTDDGFKTFDEIGVELSGIKKQEHMNKAAADRAKSDTWLQSKGGYDNLTPWNKLGYNINQKTIDMREVLAGKYEDVENQVMTIPTAGNRAGMGEAAKRYKDAIGKFPAYQDINVPRSLTLLSKSKPKAPSIQKYSYKLPAPSLDKASLQKKFISGLNVEGDELMETAVVKFKTLHGMNN